MLINMTPHVIAVNEKDGVQSMILPSGTVCRLKEKIEYCEEIKGIKIYNKTLMGVSNLPIQKPNVYYIVSSMVAQTVERTDLLVPNAVRNNNRRVIGCDGFFRIIGGTNEQR